jgi:DNA-binding MarR family transcriptional regulator
MSTVVQMKSSNTASPRSETAEGEFQLDGFLPYRLAVAAASVNRLIARRLAESYKLSISEWRVLAVVARAGVLSPSTVGAVASMDKVKVSRAAANLIARGFLKQTQDPHDGRGRLLRLTRKGQTVHGRLVAQTLDVEAQLAQGLTRSEWTALHNTLRRLEAHALRLASDEGQADAAD